MSAVILGRVTAMTGEDPFGPGDPLEVARLVRRALAASGRKAIEVTDLDVVADAMPGTDALERFARRALGPHGADIRLSAAIAAGTEQPTRESRAIELARGRHDPTPGSLFVVVCLGPGDLVSALCLGTPTAGGTSSSVPPG